MSATETVVRHALGYVPDRRRWGTPAIDFNCADSVRGYGCGTVPAELAETVRGQLSEAYIWCEERFPLSIGSGICGAARRSIRRIVVGCSNRPEELLSASSAQAPGIVLMAAPWPLRNSYRLASLFAHESVHQALFVREISRSPVRAGSIGYSPWKQRLRAGRLVWHGFWTFACQFALLADAALRDCMVLRTDPTVIAFLADMESRIRLCAESLGEFRIITGSELARSQATLKMVDDLSENLRKKKAGYVRELEAAGEQAFQEYASWAHGLLKTSQIPQSVSCFDGR